MKKEMVRINQSEIRVKVYNGRRVVTLKEIDEVHERPEGTARKRFNDNKGRFILGVDFFVRNSDEAYDEYGITAPNGLTIITESGYLMLVKSFTDDLAWDIQRQLVNNYFQIDQPKSDIEYQKVKASTDRAEAMLINAKTRQFKAITQMVSDNRLSPIAAEVFGIKALEEITGTNLGQYLPECEVTYSATEVGEQLGISSCMVGRVANKYGIKAPEYGIKVIDKVKHSNKEVPSFRYNDAGVRAIAEILDAKK